MADETKFEPQRLRRFLKVRPIIKDLDKKGLLADRYARRLALLVAGQQQEKIDTVQEQLEEKSEKINITNKQLEEEKKKRDEAEKISREDPLTGLLNERGYDIREKEEIARATRYNHPLIVASLDIDGLKYINDTFGHLVGNEHLKTFAEILKQNSRTEDVLARVGGDEFSALLPEIDLEQAKVWSKRLKDALGEKAISVSIGLSPVDITTNIKQAKEKADARMYEDKREQKNNGK